MKYFRRLQKIKEIMKELEKMEREGCKRDSKCYTVMLVAQTELYKEINRLFMSMAFSWVTMPELRKEIEETVKHAIELGIGNMTWEAWERMKGMEESYVRYVLSPEAKALAKLMGSQDVRELLAGVAEGVAMRGDAERGARILVEALRRLAEDPKTRGLLEAAMREAAKEVGEESER